MPVPIDRFLTWMIENPTKQAKTKNWNVGWCNKRCREINLTSGMAWSRGDLIWKGPGFCFWALLVQCWLTSPRNSPLMGRCYKMAASSNSWAFSFRFKSTKKWANQLPQEFKTRAQELSFFAHVLDHGSDTMAGKRESAEWLSLVPVLLGHHLHQTAWRELEENKALQGIVVKGR